MMHREINDISKDTWEAFAKYHEHPFIRVQKYKIAKTTAPVASKLELQSMKNASFKNEC